MNPSNTYWNSPATMVSADNVHHFSHDGILYNIPYRNPVQTNWDFGEGNQNIYGEQKLVFSTWPETYAVGNIIPTTAGRPAINTRSWENRFSREAQTIRFNTV